MLIEVAAIEGIPCATLLEAVVGAQIDDDGFGVELRSELARSTVRQGENDDIVPVKHLGGGVLYDQIRQLGNVRHVLRHRLAHGRMPSHTGHLKIRVGRKDAQRLATCIARGTCHGNRVFRHIHILLTW